MPRHGTISTAATGYRRSVIRKGKQGIGIPVPFYPLFVVIAVLISGAIQSIWHEQKDLLSCLKYGITTGPGIILSIVLFIVFMILMYLLVGHRTMSDYIHDEQRDLTVSAHGTKGTQYWLVGEEIPQVFGLVRKEQYNLETLLLKPRK